MNVRGSYFIGEKVHFIFHVYNSESFSFLIETLGFRLGIIVPFILLIGKLPFI